MNATSRTLSAKDGKICCARCGYALTGAGSPWKKHAALSTVAISELPGASPGLHADVVLRQFACPKCLRLLDTETALPDDPFLEDAVL